jgi:hypothetical protein
MYFYVSFFCKNPLRIQYLNTFRRGIWSHVDPYLIRVSSNFVILDSVEVNRLSLNVVPYIEHLKILVFLILEFYDIWNIEMWM